MLEGSDEAKGSYEEFIPFLDVRPAVAAVVVAVLEVVETFSALRRSIILASPPGPSCPPGAPLTDAL